MRRVTARVSSGVAVVTIVVACMGVGQARAEDDSTTKARAHFEAGRKMYQISDYRGALQEFKQAFLFNGHPLFLFNIAQCHRMLGERDEALTSYRRYLAADPAAPNRAQVERMMRDLEKARATAPAGAQTPVVVPSGPAEAAQAPSPVLAPPISAIPPPAPRPTVSVAAPVTAHRSDDGSPRFYRRWWFWTLLGVAAASAVSAVLLSRQPVDPICPKGSKC
jgi:tetratricopeptide (TPR) repeat protein